MRFIIEQKWETWVLRFESLLKVGLFLQSKFRSIAISDGLKNRRDQKEGRAHFLLQIQKPSRPVRRRPPNFATSFGRS